MVIVDFEDSFVDDVAESSRGPRPARSRGQRGLGSPDSRGTTSRFTDVSTEESSDGDGPASGARGGVAVSDGRNAPSSCGRRFSSPPRRGGMQGGGRSGSVDFLDFDGEQGEHDPRLVSVEVSAALGRMGATATAGALIVISIEP